MQQRERELSAARAKVHSLSEIHRSAHRTSPELVIEQLTDRETIAAAVAHLESEAQHQVRVFDTPPYYEAPGVKAPPGIPRRRSPTTRTTVWRTA